MHFSTLFNIYNKTIIMEEFDYKKFLVENKLTPNSRLLSERSQIQTNKPLRNLVIQYIKKELPDGKDIEGLFTHEDIAKEYIKKYVTEEEPNYKAVADSDEEMNEWYKTLSYQIQGRESELNEEFDAFTREELDALQQYEDSGMFPEWLSDEEGDALVAKWRAEYEDDFIDPAGGSGLYSHV
jgi:hypothetical protein